MPLFREFSLKVDILPRDIIGNFKFSSLSHPLMNETERWISQGTHSQRSIGGACEMIISSSSLSLVVMPTFRFPKGPYVINAKGLEGQEEDDDEDDSFLSTTTTHHHFLNTPLSNTRHTSLRSQTMVHQLFFSWRKKTRAVFFWGLESSWDCGWNESGKKKKKLEVVWMLRWERIHEGIFRASFSSARCSPFLWGSKLIKLFLMLWQPGTTFPPVSRYHRRILR